MLATATTTWVPVLTSEAGLCLTTKKWQEAKVDTAVYYLDALLLKPGLSLLQDLPSLALYTNWPGHMIINASRLKANKEGTITLISPYNGSKLSLEYSQLMALIKHLKPQILILPPDILKHYPQILDNWNKEIIPYFSSNDLPLNNHSSSYGIYFQIEANFLAVKETLQKYSQHQRYVQGVLNLEQINELRLLGIPLIESEVPTQLGLEGLVYGNKELIDLKEAAHALSFTKLKTDCLCPTCSAELTRAYLHHLFAHTPLLCQRFLIQHNAFYVQNFLNRG